MIFRKRGHCGNGWLIQAMEIIHRFYQLSGFIIMTARTFEKKQTKQKNDIGAN